MHLKVSIFMTLCLSSSPCVCVEYALPSFTQASAFRQFTIKWPVIWHLGFWIINLAIQHISQLSLTYCISEMCSMYSCERHIMMHNDKSRSSSACDNTLSQMIRCIYIRWELSMSYISTITAVQEAIWFLRWRFICQYQTQSPDLQADLSVLPEH